MEDLVRINFDIWTSLFAFGVFQGVFLISILLSYRRNASVYFLVGLLAIVVLNMGNYLLLSTYLYREFPHLVHLSTPLLFLQGPVYYWYIRSIQFGERPTKAFWHLIPFLMAIIFSMPFFLLTGDEKILELSVFETRDAMTMSAQSLIFMGLQIVHSFVYVYLANRKISSKNLTQGPRKLAQKQVWLRRFGQFFLIYWLMDLLLLAISGVNGAVFQEAFYVVMLCNTILINVLVFFAIRSNKEFNQILLNNWNERYKNSALDAPASQQYLKEIVKFTEEKKAYLDNDLSLPKLAEELNLSSHQISQVLNLELGKSFYEFMNEYRFQEVKHRLLQPENKNLTILAIAYESGFKNKNTFNKVFKKLEGSTPSAFMREHT